MSRMEDGYVVQNAHTPYVTASLRLTARETHSVTMNTLKPGDILGDYTLKVKIAQGGMAEVYRAVRTGTMGVEREVCMKLMLPALSSDSRFVEMFIDEARIASMLRHGSIVSVEHFGQTNGVLFQAMNWVHGVNASQLLMHARQAETRLPVEAVAFLVAEMLEALEYAHTKCDNEGNWLQIVHRDVSPQNIMISFQGDVLLTDFGIARATSQMRATIGNTVMGKTAYMAPEQAMGIVVDGRADLFALGVTAYQLLAGKLPFRPDKKGDALAALLSNQRPSLREARADVPEVLARVVDGLLALDASERPTALQAREALDAVPGMISGRRSLKQTIGSLVPDSAPSTTHHAFKPQGFERVKTEPRAREAAKAVPHQNDVITRAGKATPPQSENISAAPRAVPNASNPQRSGSTIPSPAPAHSEWPTRH
jgi:serine/threonine protein kinase